MNRIEDQRPCQPMHRGVLVRVANDMQFRADCFQRNALGDQRRNLALGPLDQNSIALDRILHARGQRDRLLSNSRHRFNPSFGLRVPKGSCQ